MDIKDLIIDDAEKGIFRIHRSTMTSPEILELERERIFDRNWLYLGHESEVPNLGDYRRRTIAGRPVFFVRSSDGQVRVFLNTCTHRGAMVCRRDEGNAEIFQCFYHAWTFNNKGELIGIPDEAGYAEGFDRGERALRQPPRVEQYRGFYFLSFNPQIEDLFTYLAGAREYLDLVADQSDEGMKVVRGTNKYFIRANWKLLMENSIDGYHAPIVHQTYMDFMASFMPSDARRDVTRGSRGIGKGLGNGHAVMQYRSWARPIAAWHPLYGEEAKEELAQIRQRLVERYGEERASLIADHHRNLFIYPNLIINDIAGITIRVFWPLAPDLMEVNAWELAPAEESGERLARRLDSFLTFIGPGGFATPDDVEALESCQQGFAALNEVPWSDISRGMHREGEAQSNHELQMRVFWRQWHAQMQGLPKAERWEDLLPAQRQPLASHA